MFKPSAKTFNVLGVLSTASFISTQIYAIPGDAVEAEVTAIVEDWARQMEARPEPTRLMRVFIAMANEVNPEEYSYAAGKLVRVVGVKLSKETR